MRLYITRIFLRSILCVILLLALASNATSESLTDAHKVELLERVAKFSQATKNSQFGEVLNISLPPAMQKELAPANMSVEKFMSLMAQQSSSMMKSVEIISFDIDTDKIKYESLGDGSEFARIPTTSLMKVSGQKIRATSETLGIRDNNQWYLLRIANPQQIQIFQKVYPQFSDVNIVKDHIERVD